MFLFLYIALAFVFLVSVFKTKELPLRGDVLQEVFNDPVQATSTVKSDFVFEYRGNDYKVKPLADYELWGLVVSMNNISAWYNYYHDENSVNLKDVCVVWGDNLKSDGYLDVNFKSGEWTCYWQYGGKIRGKFFGNKLSNNHLLSDSEVIRDIIRDVKIGDQIYLKGTLVDYAESDSDWYRKSSLSRDDTNQTSRSGGACEVFFVDEAKILKKNMPFWHLINSLSGKIFLFLIVTQILLFFIETRAFFLKTKNYK